MKVIMNLELRYTIPGQSPQVVALSEPRMVVGTLLSNHVVVRAPGVDPIHAMFEDEGGRLLIVDLGSVSGVKVNGKQIEVETTIKLGDRIEIGGVNIEVAQAQAVALPGAVGGALPPPVPQREQP